MRFWQKAPGVTGLNLLFADVLVVVVVYWILETEI